MTTLYAGTTARLTVRGTDGLRGKIIDDASCVVNLFGPGKNPRDRPEDREHPDHVASASFDSSLRYYTAAVSTEGWAPGTWWMQGVLSGGSVGYHAFDFESFTLAP